jgi:D-alanyl-D-alanine endopeptidase (penicillin-binding protein 7)
MRQLLLLIFSLFVFLAAPVPTLTASAEAASHKGKSAQTSSAKKKALAKGKHKAKTSAKKKKVAAKGNNRLSAKQKKRAYLQARRAAMQRQNISVLNAEDYQPSADLFLRSASALVLDQRTGQPIYEKNPQVETPIASITKLMTAMVTLDAGLPLGEEITVGDEDLDRVKGTGSRLRLGTTLSREELLHLALIASENRAAAALSRAYPGGRGAFVEAMNRKALALGMQHTHFVDGTGLSSSNRSTAVDLARLVDAAYRYPLIRRISTTGSYEVSMPGRQHARQVAFNNTNPLTKWDKWEIGVSKTGYISEAGHCLVMQASIAERNVIIVLLDSWGKYSRIGDANRIRKWMEHNAADRIARKVGREQV